MSSKETQGALHRSGSSKTRQRTEYPPPTRRLTRSASIQLEEEKKKSRDPLEDLGMRQWITAHCLILGYPLGLMFLGGTWYWPQGWLFSCWQLIMSVATETYLFFYDRALMAQRFKTWTPGQKKGDRAMTIVLMVCTFVTFVVSPLDAKRYNWTNQILPDVLSPNSIMRRFIEVGGFGLILGSSYFLFRSFCDNTFLSPVVEIQKERGHRVIQEGCYAVVRHPMYTGALMMHFGFSLLIGSSVAFLLAVILTFLLGTRAISEEELLKSELEGYEEYQEHVPYRLIPFVF